MITLNKFKPYDFSKADMKTIRDCSICLFDSTVVKIHDDGVCEMCRLQDKLRPQAMEPFTDVVSRIKSAGKNKQYDCLVGISGGEDSSVMLYLTVKVWGLRPLVIHFDNHGNSPEANNNIEVLVKKLNVNFIRYYVDKREYDEACEAMVWSGVQDTDISNDCVMAKLLDDTCHKYGIKYLMNGHDYRNEGSSPASWSQIDSKYLKSVYSKYPYRTKAKLTNLPLLTFWDQIESGIYGIKQIRPFHHEKIDRTPILKELKSWGWQWYGAKHAENIFTEFVGCYLLPVKFGIDKRITYLSAQIREGVVTKEAAKEFLNTPMTFDLEKLGDRKTLLLDLMNARKGSRSEFEKYNFRKWKLVMWILANIKVIPYTLYHKFAK